MENFKAKIELDLEIEAFDEVDAKDYILEIFGIDDEVKNIKIINIKNSWQESINCSIIVHSQADLTQGENVSFNRAWRWYFY